MHDAVARQVGEDRFAIGVPRGVIGRAHLVQFAIPPLGAIALGGLLGLGGARAYYAMGAGGADAPFGPALTQPATFWCLVAALSGGVLVAAGLAGLAARERM